jgi:hypothetical protein
MMNGNSRHLHFLSPPPTTSPHSHSTMAKTKAAKRKSNTNWTGADHSDRTAKRIASLQKKQRKRQEKLAHDDDSSSHQQQPKTAAKSKSRLSSQLPQNTYKRTHLAHDNDRQIELSKLRLATSQIQRQISLLKSRLESWDPSDTVANDALLKYNNGVVTVVTADGNGEVSKRMEVDAVNRRMDREAREKARGEQILVEAVRGVNSSVGRRKGQFLCLIVAG